MVSEQSKQTELGQLELINQAIITATRAHVGQVRKGTDTPYIVHPYAVAMLARNFTSDPEVIMACLLHDVLEDVAPEKYSEADMRRDFGTAVTNLVKVVSEPKTTGHAKEPENANQTEKLWKMRKQAYFTQLTAARDTGDRRALVVSAADKICNLSDILHDLQTIGAQVWQKFAVSREEELWFYQTVLEIMQDNLPNGMAPLYRETLTQVANWPA